MKRTGAAPGSGAGDGVAGDGAKGALAQALDTARRVGAGVLEDRDLKDWRVWRDDVLLVMAFLTRLPVRAPESGEAWSLARAARLFPLAGIVVGLIAGLAFALAHLSGLPPLAAAFVAVGVSVLVTGGLHEDGLADTADGFGGGRDRESKLALMRDSRIGAFGVLALILSVGLRAAALAVLSPWVALGVLVASGGLSRAAMAGLMVMLPPARADGLGHGAGRPSLAAVAFAGFLAVLAAVLCLGAGPGAGAVALALAVLALVALLARAQIGGYTGDVLGAGGQTVEVAVLLMAAVVLS